MARISENWISNRDEGCNETRVYSHRDVGNGEAHARTNHADDTGDENAEDAGDGEPGEAVEGAREREDEGWDCEDACIEHEAEFTIGERTEGNLAGKELATGGEDGEDDGAEGEDFTSDGAEEDEACVTHVVYLERSVIGNRVFESVFAVAIEGVFFYESPSLEMGTQSYLQGVST